MDNWTKTKTFTRFIFIFSFIALAFALACHTRPAATLFAPKLNPHETLVVALSGRIENLDWNMSTDISSSVVENNIMEGLTSLEFEEGSFKVLPALAEKWEKSNSGLEYTFHLRDNVKWSDGKPLVAGAFVDSIERLLTAHSPWAESLFVIRGSRSFYDGKGKFSEVGVKATDDKTIKINLQEPAGYFLTLFSHPSTFPIRKDLIDKNSEKWSLPAEVVTLGAYGISHYDSQSLVLKRNENYSLKAAILKNINFSLGVKGEDVVELFKSGEINAAIHLLPQDLKGLNNQDDLFYTPIFDVTYLTFDVRQKPMSNPIFRRVVGMSLDREQLVHALKDPVKVDGSMVPPGLVGYESNRGVRFDPEASKELMKHSGYGNLDKYSPMYLRVNLAIEEEAAAINVQSQLKNALNIEIKIKHHGEEIPKNAPTLFLSHWAATAPDPDSFLSLFTSMSLFNPTGWKNKNYDDFVKQGAQSVSNDIRERLYAKAQHILTETEMPVIPLFTQGEFSLVNRHVKNFPLNQLSYFPFKNISLE